MATLPTGYCSTFIDPLELKNVFNSTPNFKAEVKKRQIQDSDYVRFRISNFPKTIKLLDRTVTCHPTDHDRFQISEKIYAQPTWLCNNLTVDGHRLPFHYSVDSPELVLSAVDKFECGEYDPYHSQLKLCHYLLKSVGLSHAAVHSYMVDGGSCDWADKRMIFRQDKTFENSEEFYWETIAPGHGYARSILCGVQWTEN